MLGYVRLVFDVIWLTQINGTITLHYEYNRVSSCIFSDQACVCLCLYGTHIHIVASLSLKYFNRLTQVIVRDTVNCN